MLPLFGMFMNVVGLIVNFVGAVLLGLSSRFWTETGFGGPHILRDPRTNKWGWFLLALGFAIQVAVNLGFTIQVALQAIAVWRGLPAGP
jgi:hypothetical protein